jgi:8-oxo-dGTP pyrophosphatase MutT (NUDIX family)
VNTEKHSIIMMLLQKFYLFMEERTRGDLPGREAQLRMAPDPVDGIRNIPLEPEGESRNSSVLALIHPGESGDIRIVLTHRTETIVHGGQLSFPGGASEDNETPEETALREAEEEIGIKPSEINLAGSLSNLYLYRSNNLIKPVLGFQSHKPEMKINPAEVQEAFTVSLNTLLQEDNLRTKSWTLNDKTYQVPYWDIHKVPLWGATAMIMSELLVLYREFKRGL